MTADEPQLDLTPVNVPGYLAVTVSRRVTTKWAPHERKVAILTNQRALVLEAPAPGERVTVTIENVDDHA